MTLSRALDTVLTLHKHPRLVQVASTPLGKALIWLIATALLVPDVAPLVSPILVLVILMPERRNAVLSLGSLWVGYAMISDTGVLGWPAFAALAAITLGLPYICYRVARSFGSMPALVRSRPQVVLHVLILAAVALPSVLAVSVRESSPQLWSGLVGLTILLPLLAWRCGYLLMSGRRGTARSTRFIDHLFYCLPAYGGTFTYTPYGKGYDYLAHSRVPNDGLARVRLSGIKLLVMAWMWRGVRALILVKVHGNTAGLRAAEIVESYLGDGSMQIPRMIELIASPPAEGVAIATAWASLFLALVMSVLNLAIGGHIVIGCLRLFGFNVFRNTYKPLLAQSVVEFWNRYYYYFKELLVEFFFFPTYVRYFKSRPRLRMLAAIMMAALVGNTYYHVLGSLHNLLQLDGASAWDFVGTRAFYCTFLALGIYVSMVREQGRRGQAVAGSRKPSSRALVATRRIAGVWLFFGIIHIWNITGGATFSQRNAFFLSLFGFQP